MIEIKPHRIGRVAVSIPGSKSYTHRMLIGAALADGPSTLINPLHAEDTRLTRDALRQLGAGMEVIGDRIHVRGTGGRLRAPAGPIHLGNSGTSMRLLTALAALADGETTLTGTDRLCERPVGDLLEALRELGVEARSVRGDGCPPVFVSGGSVAGGGVSIKCGTSSQYLSGLLLLGPRTRDGLEIEVAEGPVSKPYIDMTIDAMARFGIEVRRRGYERFSVPGGRPYRSGTFTVEPDLSNASYFWAAAAVTGGSVKVNGVSGASRQGDLRITDCLARMGCRLIDEGDGLRVEGRAASDGRPLLAAVEADMGDMPDMVPTLAVVAAFARGRTVIRNVAHLRAKESDRLAATIKELGKMGIEARADETDLTVIGGIPRGASIDTYDDHRMAMSFSVAGLAVPGVVIRDEECVRKSFPGYWETFQGLYAG